MEKIKKSLFLLNNWFEKNGWRGYDPYDVWATKPFSLMQKNRYTNFAAEKLATFFPRAIRVALSVKPNLYPLVPFHLSHAYLNMYELTKNRIYFDNAKVSLSWLESNSWGEPFDWQSKIFIPKGTPDAYNIVNICNLFLRAHKIFKKDKYIDIVKDSCDLLVTKLNRDVVSKTELCFSYTPLDNFHVHNVNLYVASLLYKLGTILNEKKYLALAKKSMNYTLNCQNDDGSWFYWGPPEKSQSTDNFHTAFVLGSLLDIYDLSKNKRVLNALEKGYSFYIHNLFVDKTIPKAEKMHLYPIDIHACAQSILLLCEIRELYPQSTKIANNVASWTIDNMQDPSGYFFYRKYSSGRVDKSAYVRWGDAPMLNALSKLAITLHKSNG